MRYIIVALRAGDTFFSVRTTKDYVELMEEPVIGFSQWNYVAVPNGRIWPLKDLIPEGSPQRTCSRDYYEFDLTHHPQCAPWKRWAIAKANCVVCDSLLDAVARSKFL